MDAQARVCLAGMGAGLLIVALAVAGGAGAGVVAVGGAVLSKELVQGAINAFGGLAGNYSASQFESFLAARQDGLTDRLRNHDLFRVAGQAVYTVVVEVVAERHPSELSRIKKDFVARWNQVTPEGELENVAGTRVSACFRDGAEATWSREIGAKDWAPIVEHLTAKIDTSSLPVMVVRIEPNTKAAICDKLTREFVRRFTILLRSDQRAFNGTTLNLLSDTYASVAATEVLVRQLSRRRPTLTTYAPYRQLEPKGTNEYLFKSAVSGLVGRTELFESVVRRVMAPREHPLMIIRLTGKAGMGKSRLGMELCRWLAENENWDAGFLDREAPPFDFTTWTPICDTCIAVDYVSTKRFGADSTKPDFERLVEALFDRPGHGRAEYGTAWPSGITTTLILIDRPEDGPFWTKLEGTDAYEAIKETGVIHIALDREEDGEKVFDQLYQLELKRRTGEPVTKPQMDLLAKAKPRLKRQYRPLFAMLAAEAVALGEAGADDWTPEVLVRHVLDRQFKHWGEAGVTDHEINALVLATMKGGASFGECAEVPEYETDTFTEHVRPLGDSSADVATIGGWAPDLIGELLVLKRLGGALRVGNAARPVVQATEALWKHSLSTNPLPSYEFLARCYDDYYSFERGRHPDLVGELLAKSLPTPDADLLNRAVAGMAFRNIGWTAAEHGGTGQKYRNDHVGALDLPFVQEGVATGLYNASVKAKSASLDDAIIRALRDLYGAYPDDAAVRERYAMSLVNVSNRVNSASLDDAIIRALRDLYGAYPDDAAFREQYAMGLFNVSNRVKSASLDDAIIRALRDLYGAYPDDAAVREQYAMGLVNVSNRVNSASLDDAIIRALRDLYGAYPDDAAVREPYAMSLFNASIKANSASLDDAIIMELQKLHAAYPDDLGVLKQQIKGLGRLVLSAGHLPAVPPLVDAFNLAIPRTGEDEELMQLLTRLGPVLKELVERLHGQSGSEQ